MEVMRVDPNPIRLASSQEEMRIQTQREGFVKTLGEGGRLQAKEQDPQREPTQATPRLGPLAPRDVRKSLSAV